MRERHAIFRRDVPNAESSVRMTVVRSVGNGLLERFGEGEVVGTSIPCTGVGPLAVAPPPVVALGEAIMTGFAAPPVPYPYGYRDNRRRPT